MAEVVLSFDEFPPQVASNIQAFNGRSIQVVDNIAIEERSLVPGLWSLVSAWTVTKDMDAEYDKIQPMGGVTDKSRSGRNITMTLKVHESISFIHSGYFYSAFSSPLLLRGPTWRLERGSNP